MHAFLLALHRLWQSAALHMAGARIEGRVWLQHIEWPRRPRCIALGDGAALDRGVTLLATCDTARITIGARTYINRATMLDASELIEIGSDAMIGPFCYITDHDHDPAAPQAGALVCAPTKIGAGCWLGAHVVVLKGVTIGEGSVQLRDAVSHLLTAGRQRIILNLEGVTYVDSSGIGELVSRFTTTKNAGGQLKLLKLTKKIKDLLMITKLLTVFEIYEDEDSAMVSFS